MAYTLRTGQVVIGSTGTAVQLSSDTTPLANGIIISAKNTNDAAQAAIGGSNVTDATDGTGNGIIVAPGQAVSLGGLQGISPSLLYVNGVEGDIFSFIGN